MSILQSKEKELRYLKRKNLEEESKVIGNYYRDIVRSFGIDCTYYKRDTKTFQDFKGIVDQNTMLKHAYGYDDAPSYELSANMIVYPEVAADVFQLNKFGIVPQLEIDFIFDSTDFACALAPKIGRYKEYPIEEMDVYCEVPDIVSGSIDIGNGQKLDLSANTFPYELGLGHKQYYKCDMLSGKFQALISSYVLDEETTIVCNPYEHTTIFKQHPANDDLYRSLQYTIENDDYVETLIYLTYKVSRIQYGPQEWRCFLTGKIHGSVLFFDLDSIGKYTQLIHPQVGDLVAIDFPDEQHREKYEITDCFDKQLTQDGINPLLHKYVWKCKAIRFTDSYNDAPEPTEGDERLQEQMEYENRVHDQIVSKIAKYDSLDNVDPNVKEDATYGGYDGVSEEFDKMIPNHKVHEKYDFLDDGTALDIIVFGCGAKLVTTGYELLFIDINGDAFQLTTNSKELPVRHAYFEQGLRWLKSSDSQIVFVNIQGEATCLACDDQCCQAEAEQCLNDLHVKTLDEGHDINNEGDNFYKFKESRSYLWTDGRHLYAKLTSGINLIQLV